MIAAGKLAFTVGQTPTQYPVVFLHEDQTVADFLSNPPALLLATRKKEQANETGTDRR
jgi:hypothetical protein